MDKLMDFSMISNGMNFTIIWIVLSWNLWW